MPPISKQKRDKISEQILHYLYSVSPSAVFTSSIAENLARDEEFTKALLEDLEKNNLVIKVTKNHQGKDYERWQRWRLSENAYSTYKTLSQ